MDISGKTHEEIIDTVARLFDEAMALNLVDAQDLLCFRGASAEELRIELERLRAEIADTRRKTLQRIRAWLETGHEGIH